MSDGGIGGRRRQTGLVGDAGADGFSHGIIDFEDDALGAVIAVTLGFVLALHDGEGVHDVVHSGAGSGEAGLESRPIFCRFVLGWTPVAICLGGQVEMEEGGIQLAAEQESAFFIPTEWRAWIVAILRERLEIPCCVCEFQHSGKEPAGDGLRTVGPLDCLIICRGRQYRKLVEVAVCEVQTTDLLPGSKIEGK